MKHTMRQHMILGIAILAALSSTAWADPPDFVPQVISETVDTNAQVTATGLEFGAFPNSGDLNFSPKGTVIHLPNNIDIAALDVVPFFGLQPPMDCDQFTANYSGIVTDLLSFYQEMIQLYGTPLTVPTQAQIDAQTQKLKDTCIQTQKTDPAKLPHVFSLFHGQNVADIRNKSSNPADGVVVSGESLVPYLVDGFPLAGMGGYSGTVVGESGNGKDIWTDGVVLAQYDSVILSSKIAPTLAGALSLYRFLPNAAGQLMLQHVDYSSSWADPKQNPTCYDAAGKPLILKSLIANHCIGEDMTTSVVAMNFEGHADNKMKDLFVVSRAPYGDWADPKTPIGYITLYTYNENVHPTMDKTTKFHDFWSFGGSYTSTSITTGIPESYGSATLRNTDPSGKITESLVVASNRENKKDGRQYVYLFSKGMTEAKPIQVGLNDPQHPAYPGNDGFAPYRIYTINSGNCGDIIVTRAAIGPKTLMIQFSPYFDLHVQDKDAQGNCLGTFEPIGTKYEVSTIDPKGPLPQISSLAIGDFNKDGQTDIMAIDYTDYKVNNKRTNYAHFLEGMKGLFNTVAPPRYVVNTKEHSDATGPIDGKMDPLNGHLGVVIGTPMKFKPIVIPPQHIITQNACTPVAGQAPLFKDSSLCSCTRDNDLDGKGDLQLNSIYNTYKGHLKVDLDCNKTTGDADGYEDLDVVDNVMTQYTDCTGKTDTKPAREWLVEWSGCDNCSVGDTCTGFEKSNNCVDKFETPGFACTLNCANPSQTDSSKPPDGFGDFCTAPTPPVAKTCSVSGFVYDDTWLAPKDKTGNIVDNDTDQDGVPDCVVFNGVISDSCLAGGGSGKIICDNCSQYYEPPDLDCKADPANCFNPDQKSTKGSTYGDICAANAGGTCGDGTPFPAGWLVVNGVDNDVDKDGIPDFKVVFPAKPGMKIGIEDCDSCNPGKIGIQCQGPAGNDPTKNKCYNPTQTNSDKICPAQFPKNEPKVHEDKVMYADAQPVIAYEDELKLAGGMGGASIPLPDNGKEVTILLNKTGANPVPPPPGKCGATDLKCKCKVNPSAPECNLKPDSPPVCYVDSCRNNTDSPYGAAVCDYMRRLNDQFRKDTGQNIDLVLSDGTQYHAYCFIPTATSANVPTIAALDLGAGAAYLPIYQTGPMPRNYNKDQYEPVAANSIVPDSKPLLLTPPSSGPNAPALDISNSPTPDFPVSALADVVPMATVNQAPGITQIDGIMQVQTALMDPGSLDVVAGTKQAANPGLGAAAAAATKVLVVDVKGTAPRPACNWPGATCTNPIGVQPGLEDYAKAGANASDKSMDGINRAFKELNGSPYQLMNIIIPLGKGMQPLIVPVAMAPGGQVVSGGGCSCAMAGPSTLPNVLLPLVLAAAALGGMFTFRCRTAKKH